MPHFVYILECSDKSLYTGYTNDLQARIYRHNQGQGAKYTRARRPVVLKYFEKLRNYSNAKKREAEIQSWDRKKKLNLVNYKKKKSNH
ncbi:MAG: GIY-YIG nuclease family protein [Patescibacteria group bacterium]